MNIHNRAARLRRRGTKWEQIALQALRRHKVPFLFQYVFRPYIVDFWLYDRATVLEIDGDHHLGRGRMLRDGIRSHRLVEDYGVERVIRWRNRQVTDGSLPRLIRELRELPADASAVPDLTYGFRAAW